MSKTYSQLSDKNKHIRELQHTNDKLQKELAQKQKELATKQKELEQKQKELDTKETEFCKVSRKYFKHLDKKQRTELPAKARTDKRKVLTPDEDGEAPGPSIRKLIKKNAREQGKGGPTQARTPAQARTSKCKVPPPHESGASAGPSNRSSRSGRAIKAPAHGPQPTSVLHSHHCAHTGAPCSSTPTSTSSPPQANHAKPPSRKRRMNPKSNSTPEVSDGRPQRSNCLKRDMKKTTHNNRGSPPRGAAPNIKQGSRQRKQPSHTVGLRHQASNACAGKGERASVTQNPERETLNPEP